MVSGAGAAAKDITSDAAKRAYENLKQIFVRHPSSGPGSVIKPEANKEIPIEPVEIRKRVENLNKQEFSEALERAEKLLNLLRPSLSQTGYSVSVQGDVHSLVQGSQANVTINQQRPSSRRQKKRSP
jgi:hypothetical protein